jgi:hypothetical protein
MWYKEISADEVSADVTQDGQAVGIFTAAKMECHGYFNRADRNQHTVEVKILMPPKSGIFVTVVTPGPRVPFSIRGMLFCNGCNTRSTCARKSHF